MTVRIEPRASDEIGCVIIWLPKNLYTSTVMVLDPDDEESLFHQLVARRAEQEAARKELALDPGNPF